MNDLSGTIALVDPVAIIARGREVIRIEAEALEALEELLDDSFVAACERIYRTRRQLVVTGMGKSGHIGRKLAATFAATGTPAMFVHPAEAAHGDLGMLVEGDALLVLSNSGNTAELGAILDYAQYIGVPIIGVAADNTSLLMEKADIGICLPNLPEACTANVAPTTSTTLQLALGDALAMAVMDMRGISRNRLRTLHPGGTIGMELTPVSEIMHGEDRMPLIGESASIPDAISMMTSSRFGVCGVVDHLGNLVGIITDGDIRRHFDELATAQVADIMTRSHKMIPADMLAGDALKFLNRNKITAAFVLDRLGEPGNTVPVGIVHIHDLLRFGLN